MPKATGLPLLPEEITAEWLTVALGRDVAEVRIHDIVWGTATKVLLRLTYAEDPGPGGPPAELCAKGGFQAELRDFGISGAYRIEAAFYEELGPSLGMRLPRSWYSGMDEESNQGVVLFDDLLAAGATFGEPVEPWPPDRVAAGLEQQALWHGRTWGARPGAYPKWLTVGSAPVRAAAAALFSPEHYERQLSIPDGPRLPASLQDHDLLQGAFRRLWELDDAGVHCFAHGDAHIGNTFMDADGAPGFLDWQAPCLAPAFYDVAYFITGALTPEDRRSSEHDLIAHYLEALTASGGPQIDRDAAWLDYRRHALHGFLWALTPPVMQPLERVVAMGARHTLAIEELETLEALGV